MSTQSTPIQKLLIEEEEEKLQDKQVPHFHKQESPQYPGPQISQMVETPAQNFVHQNKKEFFGLKNFDYMTTFLVFIILLVLTSGIFNTLSRTYISGSVGPEGRVTIMGTFITAIIGTLTFIIVKMFGKF